MEIQCLHLDFNPKLLGSTLLQLQECAPGGAVGTECSVISGAGVWVLKCYQAADSYSTLQRLISAQLFSSLYFHFGFPSSFVPGSGTYNKAVFFLSDM